MPNRLQRRESENPRRQITLVEDDEGVRRSLQLMLHGRGYDVRAYATAGAAIDDPGATQADVLIADYRLPDGNGLELLEKLKLKGWHGRSLLITAFPSAPLSGEALSAGYKAVLTKPLIHHQVMQALES